MALVVKHYYQGKSGMALEQGWCYVLVYGLFIIGLIRPLIGNSKIPSKASSEGNWSWPDMAIIVITLTVNQVIKVDISMPPNTNNILLGIFKFKLCRDLKNILNIVP